MGANRKRAKVKPDCVGRALIKEKESWKKDAASKDQARIKKMPATTDSGGSQFHLMPHMFEETVGLEHFLAGDAKLKQPKSVLERSSLDEFLECSLWSQQEYNKSNAFRIVVGAPHQPQEAVRKTDSIKQRGKNTHLFCGAFWEGGIPIPRRSINYMTGKPTMIVSTNELISLENEAFLKWRRDLAKIEEEQNFLISPFERNLEFWRQLWRVLEKSDVVVQILDARNPLFYRCIDLEKCVKEIRSDKVVILLMNKSDLVHYEVRKVWASWFKKRGTICLFFSALDGLTFYQQESENTTAAENESLTRDNNTSMNLGVSSTDKNFDSSNSNSNNDGRQEEIANNLPNVVPLQVVLEVEEENKNSIQEEISHTSVGSDEKRSENKLCDKQFFKEETNMNGNDDDCGETAIKQKGVFDVLEGDSTEGYLWRFAKEGQILSSTEFLQILQGVKKLMIARYINEANDATNKEGNIDDHDYDDEVDFVHQGDIHDEDEDDDDDHDDDDHDDEEEEEDADSGDDGIDDVDHDSDDDNNKSVLANDVSNLEQQDNNLSTTELEQQMKKNDGTKKKLFRMCRSHKNFSFTVGFVGYPNVGKSSIINSLLKHKAVSVSRQPGKTKHFQTLPLPALGLTLCDCPGLVFPQIVSTAAHLVVYGVSPIDHVKGNYFGPVQIVCDLISDQLIRQYNLETKLAGSSLSTTLKTHNSSRRRLDALQFLTVLAISRGFVSGGKGAVPDMWQAAKIVLRDFTTGRLKFCILPPDMKGDISELLNSTAAVANISGESTIPGIVGANAPITTETELEKDDILLLKETVGKSEPRSKRNLTKRGMRFQLKREIKDRGFWHVPNF